MDVCAVVFFLSNVSPNRCRNDERTDVNEETRGEAEDYVHGQQMIDNDDDIGVGDEDRESPRRRVRCCKPKIYVSLASAMAALGGVLFGYDTGKSTDPDVYMHAYMSMDGYMKYYALIYTFVQ